MRLLENRPQHDRLRRLAPLLALLIAGSAWAAPPPDAPSPDAQGQMHDRALRGNDKDANAAPLPWSSLDSSQRAMLAPLQAQWDQMPPHRQQRMAEHAQHWAQLPPDRLARVQQHLSRWAQMTPDQRRDAWHGEDKFRSMPEADRQRVLDAYQRFKALSPDQRRALMQRFREEHGNRHGGHGPARDGLQPPPDAPPPPAPPPQD